MAMKNNQRLATLVKEFQRLLHIYLTTPHGCEIAALRMAEMTRKRVKQKQTRCESASPSCLAMRGRS